MNKSNKNKYKTQIGVLDDKLDLSFDEGDIETDNPNQNDVIYSNQFIIKDNLIDEFLKFFKAL